MNRSGIISVRAEVIIFSRPYIVMCDLIKDFPLFFIYVASITPPKKGGAVIYWRLLLLKIKFHEIRVGEE